VSSFQFLKFLHVSLSLSSCTTPQTLFPVINDKAVELIFMFSTYPLKSSSQKQVGISTCFHNVTISNKTAITKDICFYLKAPCHPLPPLTNKATLKMNALKLYIIRCSHKHKTQIWNSILCIFNKNVTFCLRLTFSNDYINTRVTIV